MAKKTQTHIEINSKRYALDILSPIDAIRWFTRVTTVLGPTVSRAVTPDGQLGASAQPALTADTGLETSLLIHDALKHCYTPEDQPLRDDDVLNTWFREYPKDMLELGIRAAWELVADFFPNGCAIATHPLLRQ